MTQMEFENTDIQIYPSLLNENVINCTIIQYMQIYSSQSEASRTSNASSF
jgi:hypothetical protein